MNYADMRSASPAPDGFARNRERDAAHVQAPESAGWKVLTIWECDTTKIKELTATLKRFLR